MMPAPATRKYAVASAKAAAERKAEKIVVLDVRKIFLLSDYFVICSGANERQLAAIADEVEKSLANLGRRLFSCEGRGSSSWVLMDFSDVVVHIFLPQFRDYYDLEGLWADARKVDWKRKPPSTKRAATATRKDAR